MRLEELKGPEQLKGLSMQELEGLAQQIREKVIKTVSETGGHLAPNLGTVELTLALHTVFNSPTDKLVWDVSHQAYPHKLVTGRFDRFETMRQYGGLAGFTDPRESEHDHYHWGHASTSISAAMGMAKARDLSGERYEVIAIIGDGAMTGGMAFEALDHAGHDNTRMIVVLNDNSMSISPNVGAISQMLSRIRTGPQYNRFKRDFSHVVKRIPVVGSTVFETMDRLKEGAKHLLLPNTFFEELGWTYIGPVDGHNIAQLQASLRLARQHQGPVLVHVVTVKGQGLSYAVSAPDVYHGGGPFDVSTGKRAASSTSYSHIFGQTMIKLAEADDRVVAITAAMDEGTGLKPFAKRFPARFFDVGIAEQHATTFAAGLANDGMRPVFAVYSTFLQRAFDQVIHDVALQGLPVTFALDRGGLVEDGGTHHGVFDLSYLRLIPNLVIMAPSDENELQHMLKTAIDHPAPTAIRYPKARIVGVPLDESLHGLPIGKGRIVREGQQVALIALGSMLQPALDAAEQLAARGITATVVDPRFVKPLDEELICAVAEKCGLVVTVEEAALPGGFGSAVLELLQERGLTGVRVKRLGVPDRFIQHGNPARLCQDLGLTAAGITEAAEGLVAEAASELRPKRRRLFDLGRAAQK